MAMKKLLSDKNVIMFIEFSFVGVINTVIDAAVFFLLCDIGGINEIISNVAAYVTAATNSYLLNSRFVYHEEKYTFGAYVKFLTANTSVLIISTLSIMLISRFVTYKIIAKLITIPITVVINFVFQRFIVFKKSAERLIKESEEQDNAKMDG